MLRESRDDRPPDEDGRGARPPQPHRAWARPPARSPGTLGALSDEDFWLAAKAGDVETTETALLTCAVDFELPQDHGQALEYKGRRCRAQALHAVVRHSCSPAEGTSNPLEVLRLLVKARADLRARATSTVTTYRAAAWSAKRISWGTSRRVSEEPEERVEARSVTAVHLAAGVGSVSMLRLLLEQGAGVEEWATFTGKYHYTPIHDAAYLGRAECVKELLDWDANLEAENNIGCRAIHLACLSGHSNVLSLLLAREASMDCANKNGESPMESHWKNCGLSAVDVMQTLVKQGQYPEARSVASMLKDERHTLIAGSLLQATCFELLRNDDLLLDFVGVFGIAPRTKLEAAEEPSPSVSTFYQEKLDILRSLLDERRTHLERFWDRLHGASRTTAKVYLCSVRGIVCPLVVGALADSPDPGTLKADVASAIVEQGWKQCWKFHLVDTAACVAMLALLVGVAMELRSHGSAPTALVILVAVLVAKSLFDELRQFLQAVVFADRSQCGQAMVEHFLQIGNWIDWACIGIAVWGVLGVATFRGTMYDRGRVGLFCATQWLRLMYSLRGFEWCGPRLMPILYAVKDTGAFFTIVLCCFLAAMHAYFILAARTGPSPIYAAFLQIARLGLFGDFDLHEFEGVDTVYVAAEGELVWEPEDPEPSSRYFLAHLIFYFVGTVITVILMNIFIGILGASYDMYEDQGRELFLRERANLIRIYWDRTEAWARILPRCMTRNVAPDTNLASYLWFATREERSEATVRSIRSATAQQITALEEHQRLHFQRIQEAHFKAQQAQLAALAKQVGDLRSCLEGLGLGQDQAFARDWS